MFQQAQPYQNVFTGKLAVIASYVIVLTYFTGIMIQVEYFDDESSTVGATLLTFALLLVTFAVWMSWVDVDEQVGNKHTIDSLYVELNNKQQQHKMVGGWTSVRERGALVHARCECTHLSVRVSMRQRGLIVAHWI